MKKYGLMTKREQLAMVKKITMHTNAIAKHRDAIREIIDEAEIVENCATDAIDSLNYAVDKLSEYL